MGAEEIFEKARKCGVSYSLIESVSRSQNVPYGIALRIIIDNGKYPVGTKTAYEIMNELREKPFTSIINSDKDAKRGFRAREIALAGVRLEGKVFKVKGEILELRKMIESATTDAALVQFYQQLSDAIDTADSMQSRIMEISRRYSKEYEDIMQYNMILFICSKVPWDISSYEVNKYYREIYLPEVKVKSHIQDMVRLQERVREYLRKR